MFYAVLSEITRAARCVSEAAFMCDRSEASDVIPGFPYFWENPFRNKHHQSLIKVWLSALVLSLVLLLALSLLLWTS